MLVFSVQSLAFIAVPKTGTTAIEMALRPRADIAFLKQRKHMTARRFHKKVAPFLAQTFNLRPERFAVIRNPEEQIRSWYRYRTRERDYGPERDTANICFDEFVLAVISDDPPEHARIGSQFNMLTGRGGDILVHHLFAYESQPLIQDFLDTRFGEEIILKRKNISPDADAEIEPATLRKLVNARQAEFDLHARVTDTGGHLETVIDPA